jgi:hypothetical protein
LNGTTFALLAAHCTAQEFPEVRATLAAIADTAGVGAGDKLNVQGVFDTIFAEVFPAVHAKMVLVVRLQLDPGDSGSEHIIRIRLVDQQGHRLFEQRTRTQIGSISPGEMPGANLIFQLSNTTFHGPGRYQFLVDAGRTHVMVPLRVVGREL